MTALARFVAIGAVATLVGAGCQDAAPDADDPDEFDPHDETGQADDDDASDDDDSAADDDDDTTIEPPPDIVALALVPGSYTVDTDTSFPLIAVATWLDDTVARVTPDEFTVDDGAVLTVDADGTVTALAEGQTSIGATYAGVEATPATVTVVAPGTMSVHVIDATSGDPVEGAELFIGPSEALDAYAVTDAAGMAELTGSFSGPETVTCKAGGYYRTSIIDATTRELRMALRPKTEPETGTAVGTATWVDQPGALDVQVGLAAASIHDNPVMFDVVELMGSERTIEIYGFEMDMPANVVVGDGAEDFEAPGEPGPEAVYTLTGTFAVGDLQQAFEDNEEAGSLTAMIDLITGSADPVDLALATGVEIPEGGTVDVGEMTPFTSLSEQVAVVVPALPLGFSGDDSPVVFSLGDLGDEGLVLMGMGRGQGGVVVHEARREGALASVAARYVAVVELDGIGQGNPRSAVISDRVADGGQVLFPTFLDLTVLDAPEEMDYTWSYTGDEDASLYFSSLEGSAGTWDVWVAGGSAGFALDDIDPRPGLANADWHMTAFGLRDTSFEELIQDGDPGLEAVEDLIDRQSHTRIRYNCGS